MGAGVTTGVGLGVTVLESRMAVRCSGEAKSACVSSLQGTPFALQNASAEEPFTV